MAREPAASLLTKRLGTYTHDYNERDLALYALGLGCTAADLKYVYECHEDFAALPTFAVIPAHPVAFGVPLEQYIPNFDRVSTYPLYPPGQPLEPTAACPLSRLDL